jgi:hypothetical protein
MNGGVIRGGWEFVWAAYGVTATLFIVYTTSLVLRLREGKRK